MTQDRDFDTERAPDERMQHAEDDAERSGPSPYDQASPDMPGRRVIKKGEHEKPGPTSAEELSETGVDSGVADDDGLLQTNEVDRSETMASGAGGSMEEEELTPASEYEDDGTLGDEESA